MRLGFISVGIGGGGSGFRASFSATVAYNATPGVVGTIEYSGNAGTVSIVGGATTNEPGDNGGLFSVATNLQVTFNVNSEFGSLNPGQSLTTSDTITLTDGTVSIPVALNVTVTRVASLDEDWYWHVLSLTHNGNLPEDAGNYVGLAATETDAVTLASSGDVLANIVTLPNLTNPLTNNFSHTTNAVGADVDRIFVDVPNFYGQPTVGTDFDTAVNILVATWQHFNTEWTTDPEILLMSSIAEPGVGNAFSWTGADPSTCTREDFDAWASFNKGTTRRNWFTSTLITEAASDEPSGTFAAIDPMAYIWDAIRGTDLNDFDCADWYSDAAPHGNPDWYAALGMTIWTIMMDRQSVAAVTYPTGSVTWPTGVTTAFQNAASAFATRVSNLVQGTAVAPNAPQTDEIDIATGSGSNEIDVTVNSVPETLTNIEYSVNGGSSWANLGRTTAGSQTLTMAAGSTSYDFLWRYTNATGTGQVSVSSSGGHWTATSAAGGDVTAPTLSSATDAANGSTASTGSVSTNEGNGTLYWVVTTSATAPSVAQIQAGQDNSGSAAADSGSQSVSGTGVQTISPAPSGLSAETSYTTHFQHADAAGNDSTVVSASGFTTDAESDVTAPTLSSATDAADGSTASTGSVSTNEGNGTLYWVVTTSATAPSVAQIQAGQDNSSVAAAASGSQSVSGTGVQTLSPAPSGLSASTAYTTHFQHQDAATNDSTVASASGFTTGSGSLTAVTFDGTNDYISGTGASSSSSVLTVAMRISPDAWNSTDGLLGGFGSDGGLFSNGSDLLAWYEDTIGFTQGNLGGTVTSDTYSILITVDYAGGLASSRSLHVQVNGSTLLTQTGTGSAIDWSAMTFLSQAASHYEGAIDFLWAGHVANETYSDFFDGSDVPNTGFATEGNVGGTDPFLFFYGDSAATWNSGTDRDSNSYTMNGAVA